MHAYVYIQRWKRILRLCVQISFHVNDSSISSRYNPIVASDFTMFSGAYKKMFGCSDGKTNGLGPMWSEYNGDSLSTCNERARLDIRQLEMDIEKQRLAAAKAAAEVERNKSSADRDVEMENRWLVRRLFKEDDENRWLMSRLRMMRLANRKLGEQLRESQIENRKLWENNTKLELQEAKRAVHLKAIEEKCGILSSVVTDVRTLIDWK